MKTNIKPHTVNNGTFNSKLHSVFRTRHLRDFMHEFQQLRNDILLLSLVYMSVSKMERPISASVEVTPS